MCDANSERQWPQDSIETDGKECNKERREGGGEEREDKRNVKSVKNVKLEKKKDKQGVE